MLRLLLLTVCGVVPLVWVAAVSDADKKIIVDYHNKLRADLSRVEGGSTAADMVKMYWNDDLARSAQQWANECKTGHDEDDVRDAATGLGISVGQNCAAGQRTWPEAIQAWYDEVKDFKFGKGPTSSGAVIGHFTQVVQAQATHVGCGFKSCPGSVYKRYYTCNYAWPNLHMNTPFAVGATCSACSGFCKGNLCDCGRDMLCLNGGMINTKTCTCGCPKLYSGKNCEKKNCPDGDHTICSTDWKHKIKSMCKRMPSVRTSWCPYACGLCKSSCGLQCKNGGALNIKKCKCTCQKPFSGKDCSKKKCPAKDKSYCSTAWKDAIATGGYCKKFTNVRTELCPYACGFC